jgi:hypothetical protein
MSDIGFVRVEVRVLAIKRFATSSESFALSAYGSEMDSDRVALSAAVTARVAWRLSGSPAPI